MNSYTEARKRGDTQGQCRAYLKARAEKSCALADELRKQGILSARKAAAIKRAVRVG